MHMRHICGLSASTVFFPHYLKRHDSIKTFLNIKRVFRFSLYILSEAFRILRRAEQDVIVHVYWSLCKVLVIFIKCYGTRIFLTDV